MSFYAYKTKEIIDRNGFRILLQDCIFGLNGKNCRGVKLRIFYKGLYHASVFDRDYNNKDGMVPIRVWTVINYIRRKMISKYARS